MTYEIENLPLQTLLPAIGRAEDQLARLDELVRRSPVGQGYIERGHFFDSAASMWVVGELVHMEDLVLHDARMDVRAPTHELTIAHQILRVRRRVADAKADWAVSNAGIASLTGTTVNEPVHPEGQGTAQFEEMSDSDPFYADDQFAKELASFDAVLDQSQQVLERIAHGQQSRASSALVVGELVIRDPDWSEEDRLAQWKQVLQQTDGLPATLGAAILWDAWETLEPMQHQHSLGSQLVNASLRARGKVTSHLPGFNVGLKLMPRDRRRSRERTTRLIAFLDALSASAEAGQKEIARLAQARELMLRRLAGRRSSSSLPEAIDLVLSRPIVSTSTIAKAAKVTQRGALNLISELGVREVTGRGRYRAWGIH